MTRYFGRRRPIAEKLAEQLADAFSISFFVQAEKAEPPRNDSYTARGVEFGTSVAPLEKTAD